MTPDQLSRELDMLAASQQELIEAAARAADERHAEQHEQQLYLDYAETRGMSLDAFAREYESNEQFRASADAAVAAAMQSGQDVKPEPEIIWPKPLAKGGPMEAAYDKLRRAGGR